MTRSRITKSQKIRFLIFLSFFGLTGTHLILEYGLAAGSHITLLIWSFFVLCIPVSSSAFITSSILKLFTRNYLRYAAGTVWLFALTLNIITYFSAPYAYLPYATTFLLYRIISNPWPYWLILFASSLAGLYNFLVFKSPYQQAFSRHSIAKTAITIAGLATFFYLSYTELIVFFFAQTCV